MQVETPKITFAPLSLAELREYGEPLFREHYEEVARNKTVMVLAPDWDRYEDLDDRGLLMSIGVWAHYSTHTELAGYSVNIVGSHLHYRDLLVAQNDVFFVRRPFRQGTLGTRLLRETRKQAKACGARLVLFHAKENTSFERLLRATPGMGVQDIIFSQET